MLLFGVSLAAYWLEALAWPLQRGRDSWDYWSYFLQLADAHPPLSQVMLFRTPLTPIVTGLPMLLGGARALEVVASLAYAGAVVAWAWAVRPLGREATVVLAVAVLVLELPYAILFHLVSSDFVFGALLPLWSGAVVRAALAPSRAVLAGVGLGAAALTLARPAGQVLVLAAAVAALLAPGDWRARTRRVALALAAALVPLVVWAGVNALRYDDFTVARGGKAWVPFFKVAGWTDPANGPASRRLATAVERHVLTLPPYRRLHVDVRTYFAGTSNLEIIRMIALSDRVFGRDSDYDVLFDAAIESIREHPGRYTRAVGSTMWHFLDRRFALEPVRRRRSSPRGPLVQEVGGRPMPTPIAVSPLVPAIRYGFVWCPSDEIDRCILRRPERAFASPGERRRYVEIVQRVRDWNAQLPVRDGVRRLEGKANTVAYDTPPAVVWIAVALVALAWRRPRGASALLVLLGAAALVLLVHALSQSPQAEFALPLDPLFALAAVAALAAPRARAR